MTTLNKKNIRILTQIIEAGYTDEKAIGSMGLAEAAKLPRECRIELDCVLKCQNAVKAGKLLSFLTEENGEENEHET